MLHSEYIREVPGSRGAVLMIHGILGTPRHFDFLLPLIPADWSVYNILLDGHGKNVAAFSHTSMKKWKAQVTARLDEILSRCDHVIIVAHSMGTLFSIREAVRRPEAIDHLFLLQCPLRPRITFRTAIHSALLPFGIFTKTNRLAYSDCSITLNPKIWQYIGWIPRFAELLTECRRTRKILGALTVPCHFYQSQKDELVSMRACRDLGRHPHLPVTILPHSGHFGYSSADQALLKQEFSALFTRP